MYTPDLTDLRVPEQVPVTTLDTETTGTGDRDRVLEVAVYRHFRGVLAGAITVLLDPEGTPIEPGATGAHGFTAESLAALQPLPFPAVAPLLSGLLRGAVLAGHNVDFDLRLLRGEYARWAFESAAAAPNPDVGAPTPAAFAGYFDAHVFSGYRLCTLALARLVLPELKSHKLEAVAAALELPPFAAHRAAGDAKVAYALQAPLLRRWRARFPGKEPTLAYLRDLPVWPNGEPLWLKRKQEALRNAPPVNAR